MKKSLITNSLLMALAATASADGASAMNQTPIRTQSGNSAGGRFGAGFIFGEPTGVSLKYFLTETVAVDGALGWAFTDETDLHVHGDVLWHKHDLFGVNQGAASLYGGVGGRVKFHEHGDDRVGVRLPVGLSYSFESASVDLFVEVAPVIDLAPSTRGGFTGGVGARWWF